MKVYKPLYCLIICLCGLFPGPVKHRVGKILELLNGHLLQSPLSQEKMLYNDSAISLASTNGNMEIGLDADVVQASKYDQKEIVETLLSTGADVNFNLHICFSIDSAISLASEYGHWEIVDILLVAGAKTGINEVFLQASEKGKKDTVEALLTAGANVNYIRESSFLISPFSQDGVFYSDSAISLASANGHREIVDILLDAGANTGLEEALLQASKYDQKEIVEILLSAGADVNFVLHGYFSTISAINLASKHDHWKIVDILLGAGAKRDIDEVFLQASEKGKKDTVEALLTAGANVNYIRENSFLISPFSQEGVFYSDSAISLASAYGHREIVDILLGAGAKTGLNEALLQASKYDQKEIVETLLSAGADVNFNLHGYFSTFSAINLASKYGHWKIVDILLGAGAKTGINEVLLQASENDRKETVKALFSAGANVNYIRGRGFYGDSAISLASANEHWGIVEILVDLGAKTGLNEALLQAKKYDQKEIVETLLCAGADENFNIHETFLTDIYFPSETEQFGILDTLLVVAEKTGNNDVLLQASEKGKKEIVKALITTGANVNYIREGIFNSDSAISIASENGHWEIVNVLIKAGAKRGINEALLQASKYDEKEIVETLLSAGADVNFNRLGWFMTSSAIVLASKYGHWEIVEILLDAGAKTGINDVLIQTCETGNKKFLKSLLSAGADVNYIRRWIFYSDSAISLASANGHWEIVDILIDAGAKKHGVYFTMTALIEGHRFVEPFSLLQTVPRYANKTRLMDIKLQRHSKKISATHENPLQKILMNHADFVIKTNINADTSLCFLRTLIALLILLQTTVVKQELKKFIKITFKMTVSDKVFLLCCHDVEQHPGPLTPTMKEAYRGLFSNLFLFYWGVKNKKEFTKLAKESPVLNSNVNQMYADENKPKYWNDQYCFDDPRNPKKCKSYMPHEKCSMLLGVVESCYAENKIPEQSVLQELEAFIQKDDELLSKLAAMKELKKVLLESMEKLNAQDLNKVFGECGLTEKRHISRQNTEFGCMETHNVDDNDDVSKHHTETEKERLLDIITELKLLCESLEEESKTTNRPGRKRKAPVLQLDDGVLEDCLRELVGESASKTTRNDCDGGSGESDI